MCKEHCGGAHPAYECRKKSTAARKDVRQRNLSQPRLATEVDGPPTVQGHGLAGTQALPVDTNTRVEDNVGSRLLMSEATETTSAGTVGYKDRQPIPKPKFDRVAYQREYMRKRREEQREYRARKKNG